MNVFGIDLQTPSKAGAMAATVLTVVIWGLIVVSPWGPVSTLNRVALLVAIFVGAMSREVGIRVEDGWRHLVLAVVACVVALKVFVALAPGVAQIQ